MPKYKRPNTIGNVPDKQFQVQEIVKCGKDASYFIKSYVKISHPINGPMAFKTYPFQDRCLNAFQTHRFVITNKSRQLGLSTLSAAYSLWMSLFQRDKNVLVIATKLETAKNFIKKVSGMYDSLPRWLVMPQIKARSVRYLEFSNGSKIQAIPTGLDAGRSEALSLLILDEAAHIENIDELWLGLRPTLSTGGSCIMISTPSGVGTLFHKIWIGASDGLDGESKPNPGNRTNDFYRIELPWTVHPDRNQDWYEKEAAEIRPARGERGVLQELCCTFGATGDAFIPLDVMEKLDQCIQTPIAYYGPRNDVWIWKMPVDGHRYVIAGDIARGDAEDFSAFSVIDTSTDEIVCDYQGKISPENFGDLMIDLGHKYNKALLCPELNSFGMLTANTLKKSNYPNLYYEKIARNMYLSYTDADVRDELPGFTTGPKNREEIVAKLENRLKGGYIRVYSSRLIDELKTFVWKTNTRAQAMKGYNDDIILATAIGLSLYEAAGTSVWDNVEMTTSLLAGMSVGVKKMNGIGGMFGNENKQMPPIMTNSTLRQHTEIIDGKVKADARKNGPQDFRSNWWSAWKWILD